MIIYLAGYTSHTPHSLLSIAETLDALVMDIRLSPRSRHERWQGEALAGLLGGRYVHNAHWGNLRYNEGPPVQIANWFVGLKFFKIRMAERRFPNVILLCACRSVTECHRRDVGQRLAEDERYDVRVLDHWQTPEKAYAFPVRKELLEAMR